MHSKRTVYFNLPDSVDLPLRAVHGFMSGTFIEIDGTVYEVDAITPHDDGRRIRAQLVNEGDARLQRESVVKIDLSEK